MPGLTPALAELDVLLGQWTMEIAWSAKTHRLVGGPASIRAPASFAPSRDGGLVVHTTGGSDGPIAWWTIGRDETSGAFAVLYTDDRGVSRIYGMSFAGNVWKMWRCASGFHQRFTGEISLDQKSIKGRWEKSEDGAAWETDFELSYTKA
jgi:hypothetical protein